MEKAESVYGVASSQSHRVVVVLLPWLIGFDTGERDRAVAPEKSISPLERTRPLPKKIAE